MVRVRSGTAVDPELLAAARAARLGTSNACVVDEALAALAKRYRPAQIEPGAAYGAHPLTEHRWGDLASWRRAAG